MHQRITKRGPAPLQAEKTSARGMQVQGVRPHLGTWCQAIRCGNGSCRWIVPMVVPFGAVSMDARPAGIRHDQARGPSAEHAPGATTARLPLSEGPASSTPSV